MALNGSGSIGKVCIIIIIKNFLKNSNQTFNVGTKTQNYIDFMNKTQKPGFTYQDFAKDFTAELFNPNDWADIFADSGAKYVVLTSKHHEGYTLWPSVSIEFIFLLKANWVFIFIDEFV